MENEKKCDKMASSPVHILQVVSSHELMSQSFKNHVGNCDKTSCNSVVLGIVCLNVLENNGGFYVLLFVTVEVN